MRRSRVQIPEAALYSLHVPLNEETWLITGGAGYIGAHIADEFLSNGKKIVIFDSFRSGLESRIDYLRKKHNLDIPVVVGDICDFDLIKKSLEEFNIHGIIHTAALKSVAESVSNSEMYMRINVYATTNILSIAQNCGVKNFIFSSSAAVYGSPDHSMPVNENNPTKPISPYGQSKLNAEIEVQKFHKIEGNRGTSLRFFNVIGTSAHEMMDNSTENLVPIVIRKLAAQKAPEIFGTDFPTPDGTCIRDYVDVRDIARAHLCVAQADGRLPYAMNIGTGYGKSVREVINAVATVFKAKGIIPSEQPRRPVDPSVLCADT